MAMQATRWADSRQTLDGDAEFTRRWAQGYPALAAQAVVLASLGLFDGPRLAEFERLER